MKEDDYYTGDFGKYQKNADGSLKTKNITLNKGPKEGTEYYYFVVAYAKPANGEGKNCTLARSIGCSKSAKVVYTKVPAAKATKISSAKSVKVKK